MKYATVLFTVIFFLPTPKVSAQRHFSIGFGAGGGADAANLTLEGGKFISTVRRETYMALGVSFIFSDDTPSNLLDYPVPHWDYTEIGEKTKDEYAFWGKYGIKATKAKRIFITPLAGLSLVKKVDVARSNITGWYYQQSSDTKIEPIFGVGIAYFPYNKLSIQLDLDNRRGITGYLGWML